MIKKCTLYNTFFKYKDTNQFNTRFNKIINELFLTICILPFILP